MSAKKASSGRSNHLQQQPASNQPVQSSSPHVLSKEDEQALRTEAQKCAEGCTGAGRLVMVMIPVPGKTAIKLTSDGVFNQLVEQVYNVMRRTRGYA